jgi:hypothetical protein
MDSILEYTHCIFVPNSTRMKMERLFPLSGEEIGRLMAQALEGGAIEKRPWYQPADGVPEETIIKHKFDSLVVDVPPGPKASALRAVPTSDKEKT